MLNVIILDDQSTSLKIMQRLVNAVEPGAALYTFTDPSAALEWAKYNSCDLVITDLRMPVMNGIEFTRWFRKLPDCDDVPLVMVTIVEDRKSRYTALEAGATDFLTKPLDHVEFRARCRNLLKLREQQKIIKDRSSWLEQRVAEAVRSIEQRERDSLLHLAKAGEYRDLFTGGHVQRMAKYCRLIAEAMNLPEEFRHTIELAAPLHDIGKIGIPDSILMKKGPLSDAEREIMNTHSEIGYNILKDSPSKYLQVGAIVAQHHHERFDGKGYPHGLQGEEIPFEARIAAIADVFDALLSPRPYKPSWPLNITIEYIRQHAGTQFDPECVVGFDKALDGIIEIYRQYQDMRHADQRY
ncbi:MAG: response regulator [Candidatus Competibacterales bacterium]|nr:response regulator [Candidatus Competibacterales bacterium]